MYRIHVTDRGNRTYVLVTRPGRGVQVANVAFPIPHEWTPATFATHDAAEAEVARVRPFFTSDPDSLRFAVVPVQ